MSLLPKVEAAAKTVASRLEGRRPALAVVLGSGLGGLADRAEEAVRIPYRDIPGFPVPSVAGHAGELICGRIGGRPVLLLKGRVHLYEACDFAPLKILIYTLKTLGIGNLFLTSASGSLRPDMAPGSIMAIRDHINFMGINPLIGENEADFGPRFPAMDGAWDSGLRQQIAVAAKNEGVALHEGVFIAFRGPAFETPAEIRMAQTLGADAVGMSSVPECLLARHCGMRVAGCAVITNLGAGLSDEKLSHDHTLEGAKLAAKNLEALVTRFIADFSQG